MHIFNTLIAELKHEFSDYNTKKLSKDLMSGITVAAVALPLALAFGVSSGATAAAGLVTAIVAGIIIGAFSGASFQISGPTGAMSAILITLAAKYGMQGILISCFFAGVILLVAGFLKLGKIIYFIPSPVIAGFTSGIAIIIALGQLDNFFGVTSEGELAIAKLISYFTDGFHPNMQTVAIGMIVVVTMLIWPKKLNAVMPSSLLALIVALVFNYFAKWDVAVVGEIPKTLLLDERLSLTAIPWSQFMDFFVPAMSIAALAMIESLLCGASASKLKKEGFDGDLELVAQGVGNIVIPFLGGVPATAAIARTSVVIKAGGVTRLASIFHAVILLLSMFVLSPIMSAIPLSALAGILIVTAWRMNDWESIHFIFGKRFYGGIVKFALTMVATVMLDLTQAIMIGVGFSAILLVVKLTDFDINVVEVDNKRLGKLGISLPEVSDKVRVAYLTGTLFFAVVDKLEKQLLQYKDTSAIILSMRGVPIIDLSAIQAMTDFVAEMEAANTKIILTSVQPKVLEDMEKGGILDLIGRENIFDSAEKAIVYAHQELEL